MQRGRQKKEVKQEYRVLKPIVGWPNEDGLVEDLVPYKKSSTAAEKKKHGKYLRDENGFHVREKMIVKQHPSKVGHLVYNKSLILESEFAKFYPEEAAEEADETGTGDGDGGGGSEE